MSRIPALDPAAAQGKARDLLDAVQKTLGITPNMFRVAAGRRPRSKACSA